jgi:hypothetical protein
MRARAGFRAAVLILTTLLLSSCAGTKGPRHEVIGAVVGGVVGGGICAAAGGEPIVCTAAGLGGAAIGWGVAKAIENSARHTQTAKSVRPQRSHQPEQGLRLDVSSVHVASENLVPGQMVDVTATYVVLAADPARAHSVTETLSVWRDGRKLRDLSTQDEQRTPGEWTVERHFVLPENAYPGEYELRYEIAASGMDGEVRDENASPLLVAAR